MGFFDYCAEGRFPWEYRLRARNIVRVGNGESEKKGFINIYTDLAISQIRIFG